MAHDTKTHDANTDQVTGTMDEDYDLFGYIESCLRTARLMETYRRDAEQAGDTALTALFTMTQNDSRKGAEIGRKLLAGRLAGADRGTGTDSRTGTDSGTGTAAEEETVREPQVDVMAPATAPSRGDGR